MLNFGLRHFVRRGIPLIGLSLLMCLAILVVAPLSKSQSQKPLQVTPPRRSKKAASGSPRADGLRIEVNVVLVPVVVTDAMNRPIEGLEKENFILSENDERREIEYFSTEDAPISVGLLLDLSGSMKDKFTAEREAVTEFFRNANSQDDYFVITFSNRPKVLTQATQSIDAIQSSLETAMPTGKTAMLDAISIAMNRMRSARYDRRALLIVSDGGDNSSRISFRNVKRLVRDSDVDVYAIGLFDTALFKTFEELMGKSWLGEITDATGGRTLTIDSSTKIPEAAATISRLLRYQYVLGYRPNNAQPDGKRRRIKVQTINPSSERAQLQAHYKRGYVVPKED